MTNKEATEKYIVDEEVEFLGHPVGERFVTPSKQVAGYESLKVQLLFPKDDSDATYRTWVKSSFWSSLVTWDTTPHEPISKLLKSDNFEEIEKRLFYILSKRPISVALEGAIFNFKITGIPRSMTHQIVRHRQMSFGQQSYRVSSCYSDPVRFPVSLDLNSNILLFEEYVAAVKKCRSVYKALIERGVPMEQARNIMPMGTCTKIGVTMRLRDMIDYFKGRTSDIAQDEHTYIVCLMAREVKLKQPGFWKVILKFVPKIEDVIAKYLYFEK